MLTTFPDNFSADSGRRGGSVGLTARRRETATGDPAMTITRDLFRFSDEPLYEALSLARTSRGDRP